MDEKKLTEARQYAMDVVVPIAQNMASVKGIEYTDCCSMLGSFIRLRSLSVQSSCIPDKLDVCFDFALTYLVDTIIAYLELKLNRKITPDELITDASTFARLNGFVMLKDEKR